jgi:DNA-binding GntR family transcriptional regulator
MRTTVNPSTRFSHPHSLVEEVVRVLTARIVRGEIPPGARLIEEHVSVEFGISRTPLRESFRALEREGLLTITPRKGVRVKSIDPQEIEEIYVCRAALEGLSARLAATRATDEIADELAGILRKMEAAVARDDLDQYFSLNVEFHDIVAEVAQNKTLNQLIRNLGTRVLRFRYTSLSLPNRMKKSLAVHKELVAAFRRRDGDQAELLTRRLIDDAHAVLKRKFDRDVRMLRDLPLDSLYSRPR